MNDLLPERQVIKPPNFSKSLARALKDCRVAETMIKSARPAISTGSGHVEGTQAGGFDLGADDENRTRMFSLGS